MLNKVNNVSIGTYMVIIAFIYFWLRIGNEHLAGKLLPMDLWKTIISIHNYRNINNVTMINLLSLIKLSINFSVA